jgi:hypothetical protein
MNIELNTEIANLETAVQELLNKRNKASKLKVFESFIRLRVLHGYRTFGELPYGVGLLNETTHHLIFIVRSNTHILYKKEEIFGETGYRHVCYLVNDKYGKYKRCYGVNSAYRIPIGYIYYHQIQDLLYQFFKFDEDSIEIKIIRKEKLNKLNKIN